MKIIRRHLLSYVYGVQGIRMAFKYEPAMLLHFVISIGVILVNFLLQIGRTEWVITLMLMGLVWMAEIFNTAIERLADRVSQEKDVMIGEAKDLASGAVSILCLFAVICALIIYIPYIF